MNLLSIAAGVSPGLAPTDFVEAAAAAGWRACGIWFDAETWTDRTGADVRRRLDETGLIALDIEPVFVTPGASASEVIDHGPRVIDAAAQVGARNMLVVARGVEHEPFTERFGELCDLARRVGVTCVVEFMDFMSTRTMSAAVDVVREAGRPNGGILIDNLHLARTGGSPADVAELDPAIVPYVQVCDAPAEPPGTLVEEALDLRLAPGLGALPVAEFVAALPPDTPLSMEVRSAALRNDHPDPVDRARRLLEDTTRFLSSLEPSGH
jgi:sugar phosphate isomerase/epimerase